MIKQNRCVFNLLFIIATISIPVQGDDHWVGAKSTNDYEDNPNTGDPWFQESDYRDAICGRFVNKMDDYNDSVRKFWTGLNGAKWRYVEGSGDETGYGVDNVDIHMTCTHGGAWGPDPAEGRPATFTLVMWDYGERAFSYQMRLGDGGRKLELFAVYGCLTMAVDTHTWTRWSPVFKGGLKYAAAFWGSSYPSSGAQNTGRTYAEKLHGSGYSLRYAWLDSMDDYSGNQPGVMASGTNTSNCSTRRANMNLSNFRNASVMPRLRDSSVGKICWTRRAA